MDAREVAFKAFKVAYDRESGYVGHKVSGEEFKLDCTKFDKLLLVFRDGHYKVIELAGETVCRAGPGLLRPAGTRAGVHAGLHQPRGELPETVHLRRHDPEQGVFLHPAQVKNPVLRAGHAGANCSSATNPRPTRRSTSKPASPSQVEVKGPKTRGRQISIKEVAAINSKPPRGWDPEAPTTKLEFV